MTDAKDLRTLRWFVLRARCVAAQLLLIDRERLLSRALGTIKFNYVCPAGDSSMANVLPDGKPFESLVGRLRAFLMHTDDLYFKKAFLPLREFTSTDGSLTATASALEEHWAKSDPKSRFTRG